MSFLNSAMSALGVGGNGNTQGQGQGGLLQGLMGVVNNPAVGGLQGLLQKFNNAGMSDRVSSWVGTGPNQPIHGHEVEKALGPDHLDHVATQAGVDRSQAASGLASMLPQFVDKLTPNGKMPDIGALGQLLGQFKH